MIKRIIVCCCALLFSISSASSKFLLLMGPSGTGKSTIINHLKNRDNRFVYVAPFTTRELRPGEQDKVHIGFDELETLRESGALLAINNIYGIYYATPKHIIDQALTNDQFPVLDWPIDKIDIMKSFYGEQLYLVYVEPDDINELARRLSLDTRDKDGKRYQAGKEEIDNLLSGKYDRLVDLRIVNAKGHDLEVAEEIYLNFLKSLEK